MADILHETDFTSLHEEALACDDILKTMEDLLFTFQADLGLVSSEIQALQQKSISINTRLENRKALENKLVTTVDALLIPPSLVRKISEGDVDDVWLAYLIQLQKRIEYSQSANGDFAGARRDVQPELERLKVRASEKIRDFFIAKIKTARTPNANVQILQQSTLVKYRALNHFVGRYFSEVAHEIRQTYINTMKWYFQTHFERYMRALDRIQSVVVEKTELIGSADSSKKIASNLFVSNKVAIKEKTNIFALSERGDTLKNPESGVIVAHVAEEEGQKYPFEALFRSLNLALIDNVSSEYLFLIEFYEKFDTATEVFHEIFEPTLKSSLNFTRQYVETSYDAIGILICVRLNSHFALTLQRRKVPALESYTNATMMQLWPRFKIVIENHVESLRRAANRIVAKDSHAHYVTRQYGEFAASIYMLSEESSDDVIASSMLRLRQEYEAFILSLSLALSESTRPIFLINNYDTIVTLLQGCEKAAAIDLERFRELMQGEMTGYVKIALQPHFGFLSNGKSESAITEFNTYWKSRIRTLQSAILQQFSNFKVGTLLLQMALNQVTSDYSKFVDSASKQGAKAVPVAVKTVAEECKRYQLL